MTTRDRIFAAAREGFAQHGLAGLTVRDVARRAGLSPMAMYRHFADKDALVDALAEDGFAAWEAIARAIDENDPVAWLERLLAAFLDFALADPHRFDAAFLLPARQARRYPHDFLAGRSPVVSLMLARIDRAKAEGRIIDVPSLDVSLTLSALAQGVVSMHRAGRFAGEDQCRASYAVAIGHALARFVIGPANRNPVKAPEGTPS